MSTIVTRAGKGSPLTNNEMDSNLNNLNNDKIEAASIHSATSKATPVDADELPLLDSVSTFTLAKLTWANLKATIFGGGTLTGLLKFAKGADIASASTLNLSTATGNTVHVTGTTGITIVTMTSGQVMDVIFDSSLILYHNATTNNLPGGIDITTRAGDRARYFYDGTTVYCLEYNRASRFTYDLESINASVATNALTVTYNGGTLDFRSTNLANGAPIREFPVGSLSITVPSTATLGTVSAQQARLAVGVAYNSGTPVLMIGNVASGLLLDDSSQVSPTTISSGATSAGVWYSASAVAANSPWRLVGVLDVTEATAGTWTTAPSKMAGAGGTSISSMLGIGAGQTWQDVVGSRAINTMYYNTTGRPIQVGIGMQLPVSTTSTLSVNGVVVSRVATSGASALSFSHNAIVPHGSSYILNNVGTISTWAELR